MMTKAKTIHVLGISGSLRAASYNTALLLAAAELLPPQMTLETFDLAPLPIFNQDGEKPFPEMVNAFRTQLSFRGALKNAIDWASRPPQSPLVRKPVAIMGASTGRFGTVRAQMQLRQVLTHIGALPLAKPEVLVSRAEQAFDSEGQLVDSVARGFLQELLVALADWTRLLSSA
jgi:chromate reductase